MLVRLLALLVMLSMFPSATELVELTAHVVRYGDLDLDHADEHDRGQAPLGADEHGCSGTYHLCSCHHGAPATMPSALALEVHDSAQLFPSFEPPDRFGTVTEAPPIRPPIV